MWTAGMRISGARQVLLCARAPSCAVALQGDDVRKEVLFRRVGAGVGEVLDERTPGDAARSMSDHS